jgi:ribonuclease HI
MELPIVHLYTDGSSRGNPGPGGYGVLLISGNNTKEISAGFRYTTNNRMELLAVIIGLQALKKKCAVTVYTDSQYVAKAINENWILGWVKTNFKGKKNKDLWLLYLDVAKLHTVKFIWVKGHADNKYNNRCDELATLAADGNNLATDLVFEAENKSKF